MRLGKEPEYGVSSSELYETRNGIQTPPPVRASEPILLRQHSNRGHPHSRALCRPSRSTGHIETANRHNPHEPAGALATDGNLKMEPNFKQPVAADADPRSPRTCFVCKKQMAEHQWYCRLTQKVTEISGSQAAKILLCSPACASRHFVVSEAEPTLNTEPRTKIL